MMMMTHKVDHHLGVDGRARKTQARHHRVSWTCFCSEREVLFCEARVSLGTVLVGDKGFGNLVGGRRQLLFPKLSEVGVGATSTYVPLRRLS